MKKIKSIALAIVATGTIISAGSIVNTNRIESNKNEYLFLSTSKEEVVSPLTINVSKINEDENEGNKVIGELAVSSTDPAIFDRVADDFEFTLVDNSNPDGKPIDGFECSPIEGRDNEFKFSFDAEKLGPGTYNSLMIRLDYSINPVEEETGEPESFSTTANITKTINYFEFDPLSNTEYENDSISGNFNIVGMTNEQIQSVVDNNPTTNQIKVYGVNGNGESEEEKLLNVTLKVMPATEDIGNNFIKFTVNDSHFNYEKIRVEFTYDLIEDDDLTKKTISQDFEGAKSFGIVETEAPDYVINEDKTAYDIKGQFKIDDGGMSDDYSEYESQFNLLKEIESPIGDLTYEYVDAEFNSLDENGLFEYEVHNVNPGTYDNYYVEFSYTPVAGHEQTNISYPITSLEVKPSDHGNINSDGTITDIYTNNESAIVKFSFEPNDSIVKDYQLFKVSGSDEDGTPIDDVLISTSSNIENNDNNVENVTITTNDTEQLKDGGQYYVSVKTKLLDEDEVVTNSKAFDISLKDGPAVTSANITSVSGDNIAGDFDTNEKEYSIVEDTMNVIAKENNSSNEIVTNAEQNLDKDGWKFDFGNKLKPGTDYTLRIEFDYEFEGFETASYSFPVQNEEGEPLVVNTAIKPTVEVMEENDVVPLFDGYHNSRKNFKIVTTKDIKSNGDTEQVEFVEIHPASFEAWDGDTKLSEEGGDYSIKFDVDDKGIDYANNDITIRKLESATTYEDLKFKIEYIYIPEENENVQHIDTNPQILEFDLGAFATKKDDSAATVVDEPKLEEISDDTYDLTFEIDVPKLDSNLIHKSVDVEKIKVSLNWLDSSDYISSSTYLESDSIEINVDGKNEIDNDQYAYMINKDKATVTIKDVGAIAPNSEYSLNIDIKSTGGWASSSFTLEIEEKGFVNPDSAYIGFTSSANGEVYMNYSIDTTHSEYDNSPTSVELKIAESSKDSNSKDVVVPFNYDENGDLIETGNVLLNDNYYDFKEGLSYSIGVENWIMHTGDSLAVGDEIKEENIMINVPIVPVIDMPSPHWWLITLLLLIIIAGTSFGTYYYIVYIKNGGKQVLAGEANNSIDMNNNILAEKLNISPELVTPQMMEMARQVLQLKNDLNQEKLLAKAEVANQATKNRKSEELHEIKGRNDIMKKLVKSADMIDMTIKHGGGFVEQNKENEVGKVLSQWLMSFKGINDNMMRETGLIKIEPNRGELFNVEQHKVVGQEEVPDLPKGSVIRTEKIGYKNSDSVLKPAEVIITK